MSDESSMVGNGHAMPYIVISDSGGNDIIDPLSGVNVSDLITSFKYTYKEEEDDECRIDITCNNPDLVDFVQFREQQYLQAQWGYKYSDGSCAPSPIRKIMVRHVQMKLTPQNVVIVLECTDGASLLKTKRLGRNNSEDFLKYIKDQLSGNYGFKTYILDSKEVEPKKHQWIVGSSITGGVFVYDYPGKNEEGIKEVEPDKLLKTFTVSQVTNNPYTLLKDNLDYVPNGPYHLDGRDDNITIRPTNFNQAPLGTFTFKGGSGELLNFDIEVRKKRKKKDTAGSMVINPNSKSLEITSTQASTNIPDLSYDSITGAAINIDAVADEPTAVANLEKDENILRQYANQYYMDAYNKWQEAAKTGDVFEMSAISLDDLQVVHKATVRETVDLELPERSYYKRSRKIKKLERDENTIIIKKGDANNPFADPEVIREKEVTLTLKAQDLLSFAGEAADALNREYNAINDEVQKSIEGNLTLIGQPYLESSRMIKLLNISTKYSGDWYIKEIEHSLIPGRGYTNKAKVIKKTAATGTIAKSTTGINTTSYAKKLQNVLDEVSDPVTIAKRESLEHQLEKIQVDHKDMGQVSVIVNDQGEIIDVSAEADWVSTNKISQTDEVNSNDTYNQQVVKDKY